MAVLRLLPTDGAPIEIDKDLAVVGREPTSDLVLADGSVSRKHAQIERRGDAFFVVDHGSANGTFLNGARVSESELRGGQFLRFGTVTFEVLLEEPLPETLRLEVPKAVPPPPPRPIPPPPPPPAATAPPPPRPAPPQRPPTAPIPAQRPHAPAATGRPPAPPQPPGPPRGDALGRFAATGAHQMPGQAASPPRKGKGPFFWIGLGCTGCLTVTVLFAALIGGGIYFMSQGPVQAVRAQLGEIRNGNLDAAYARFSEAGRAQLSREQFELLVDVHPGLKDNTDSTFLNRSIQNDTATLSGTLTALGGGKEAVSYELIHENGEWRIARISFTVEAEPRD